MTKLEKFVARTKLLIIIMILFSAGCTDSASEYGPVLTAQECDAVLAKHWELQGISIDAIFSDEDTKKTRDYAAQGALRII